MDNKTIDLAQFDLIRPEKIRWNFPFVAGQDPLLSIKSKSTRAFLRTAEPELAAAGITFQVRTLDESGFRDWLVFYQKIIETNHYDLLASEEWYQKRTAQGRVIEELRFEQNGEVIGSEIFYVNEGKAVACFKVSSRTGNFSNKPNSSLGSVMDYLFLKTVTAREINAISFGQSRNAFGVINPLGNLDYKLKFGMTPSKPKTPTFVASIPIDEQGMVSFLGCATEDAELGLYSLVPTGTTFDFGLDRYNSPELPYKILTY